jgi:hypothetical protein
MSSQILAEILPAACPHKPGDWRLATIKQSAIAHLETGQYKNRPKNQRFSQLKRRVRKIKLYNYTTFKKYKCINFNI